MFPIPFNFPFRKKDGSITTMDDAISSGGGSYTLPTASADTKGGVKVGAGLTMDGETLKNTNPTPFSLPTASAETLGGVKVGSGLSIEDGVLSTSGGGGGGSKVYYKDYDYTNVTFAEPQALIENNLYYFRIFSQIPTPPNWNIQGYKIINAEVIDNYSGYIYFLAYSNYIYNNVETVSFGGIIANRTNINGSFKIRVFYVPDNVVEPIPTT